MKRLRLASAHFILTLFCLFSLFPVLWVVSMALDPSSVSRPTELKLFGLTIGSFLHAISHPGETFRLLLSPGDVLRGIQGAFSLDAFNRVLANPTEIDGLSFGLLLWNSLAVSIGTTAFGILLGATAAYAFSRFRFPGRQGGLLTFIVLQMFPPIVSMAPLYVLLSALHLRTSLLGLMIAYAAGTLPFAIWNLKGYFDTVPKDLEEAALIDGCTRSQTFWKIVLPLSAPAVAVTALFGFMTGWTEIILAWTLLENPKTFTLAMALYGMVGQYGTFKPWSEFAAMSIIISLPVVVVMLLLQRYIVSGLTSGGVKG